MSNILERAQGCLMGQLVGDSLGSLVEFLTSSEIKELYPKGVTELQDGGTWNTIAGQPTDDSEMALVLARTLIREGKYRSSSALKEYQYWLNSKPFDCGNTIAQSLRGMLNEESQANGALMRISPLGIFGARHSENMVEQWAKQDAMLTHVNLVCVQVNILFTCAIAKAVGEGFSAGEILSYIETKARDMKAEEPLLNTIEISRSKPPSDYISQQGWVLVALHNALYQLSHAKNTEKAIIDTISKGGDTDTNAAICGALLGAVNGISSIPKRWQTVILNCKPGAGYPGVHKPRPVAFWPNDALELAANLIK